MSDNHEDEEGGGLAESDDEIDSDFEEDMDRHIVRNRVLKWGAVRSLRNFKVEAKKIIDKNADIMSRPSARQGRVGPLRQLRIIRACICTRRTTVATTNHH